MEAGTLPTGKYSSAPLLGHALRPKKLRQSRMLPVPIGVDFSDLDREMNYSCDSINAITLM